MTPTAADPASSRPHLHSVTPPSYTANDGRRMIRMPGSIEAPDVLKALLANAEVAGEPIASHLWLADPSSDSLRLIHAEGRARPNGTPVPIPGTVLGAALAKGNALMEPVHRLNTAQGEMLVWRFALPLHAGEARGVAAVDFRGTHAPDIEALGPLVGAMRGSLAGALALKIARNETALARALADTSRDLARNLDADHVLTTTLEHAIALASAETGSIMLLGEDGVLHIAASRGLPPEVVAETRVAEGDGIAGWVLASGQALVVEDLGEHGPESRRHGVRSAISVPIADDHGVLGVLNVGSRTFHARFSRSDLSVLESLGRTAAVALRNAQVVGMSRELYFDTLKALAIAMESKDPYARGATAEVLGWAMKLGRAMALTPAEMDALRIAAMLHDIGMSAAGDVVAVSNRQLSTVEWGMLKMHPLIAAEILDQAPALKDAVPIVYHHHEHYDGGGYVGGLAGDAIPLGARILAVADAFVAITSPRPYRAAKPAPEAAAELTAHSGSQFDPRVVRALVELLATGQGIEAPAPGPTDPSI